MASEVRQWRASAGIWIGALAWATSTQLNYALSGALCRQSGLYVPLAASALLLLALGGGAVSLDAFFRRRRPLATERPEAGTPTEMLAVLGAALGAFFALIIAFQGLAAFIVGGCVP